MEIRSTRTRNSARWPMPMRLPRSTADVKKTVAAGARVLTGGHPLERPGNFYAPTVLTDIPKDSPAYNEEFFGPVASIFRVKDIDEAIRDRQR